MFKTGFAIITNITQIEQVQSQIISPEIKQVMQ